MGWELNLVNRRSSIGLPNFKPPNSLHDVINCTVIIYICHHDWFNLRTEVNAKMPIASNAVLLSILTNLCILFWSVGAIYFLCLAVGSSMVPISCTQCVTLSFTAFRSILVSDVNSQLCFLGRPQPVYVQCYLVDSASYVAYHGKLAQKNRH